MKKILFSASAIVAVAALAVYSTGALFSDTETSTGNVFTAGSIDLKVDHTKQTYNGVDCRTCEVTVGSDITNMVVAKDGSPVTPYNAFSVTPTWVTNTYWTASSSPAVAGTQWIWGSDPIPQSEVDNDTIYTFEKTFTWWGPIASSTITFGVAADNSYEVYLNGNLVNADTNENNFASVDTLTLNSAWFNQGTNTLQFKVKNWRQPGPTVNNPAGLRYKLTINGNCGDVYFQRHCTLFGEKDLTSEDHFWMFDDVKPGDYGTNLVSLHPTSNDAYICLFSHNLADEENTRLPVETASGDGTSGPGPTSGELSQYLKLFAWADDGNGVYENGENTLVNPDTPINTELVSLPLVGNTTGYVGMAWCAGTQSVVGTTISCSGVGNQNVAQTDSSTLDVTAYAVQQRNNQGFNCQSIADQYRPPR